MEVMEKPESDFFIQLLAVKTQWGYYNGFANTGITINLNLSFSHTNYAVLSSGTIASNSQSITKSTNRFICAGSTWSNSQCNYFYWAALG